MGAFSIWHWVIVLIVVVLLFGTKKLRNLGGDLGSAIRGFRQGMKEDSPAETPNLDDPDTITTTTTTTTASEASQNEKTTVS